MARYGSQAFETHPSKVTEICELMFYGMGKPQMRDSTIDSHLVMLFESSFSKLGLLMDFLYELGAMRDIGFLGAWALELKDATERLVIDNSKRLMERLQ